jgi:hypothetical protein
LASNRYPSHKANCLVNATIGLVALQLGLRGVVLWLSERAGETFDVIGAVNGPKYFWLLVPESWTIDLITRFAFWLLLPVGIFFLSRAFVVLKTDHVR